MKALVVKPFRAPEPVEVDGYESIKGIVGGSIEAVGWVFDNKPTIYVNGDGKLCGCEPNRVLYAPCDGIGWSNQPIRKGDVLDVVFGNMVLVGFDPETGEDRDITDEEAARVFEAYGNPDNSLIAWAIATGLMPAR